METTNFRFDVFLSHSSADKEVVRELANRLKRDGLRVWLDEWEINPGDSIPAKIEEGLEQSRVLMLCMSANAFGSDWAALEQFTFRFRDPLNKSQRFLPLRLDDAAIPGSLAQFLYISWAAADREQAYPRLLEACGGLLSEEGGWRSSGASPQTTATSERSEPEQDPQQDRANSTADSGGSSLVPRESTPATPAPPATPVEDADQERFLDKIISLGHTGTIYSVAVSPDGRRALSGSSDKTVRVWDVSSGRCERVLEGTHVGCLERGLDRRRTRALRRHQRRDAGVGSVNRAARTGSRGRRRSVAR